MEETQRQRGVSVVLKHISMWRPWTSPLHRNTRGRQILRLFFSPSFFLFSRKQCKLSFFAHFEDYYYTFVVVCVPSTRRNKKRVTVRLVLPLCLSLLYFFRGTLRSTQAITAAFFFKRFHESYRQNIWRARWGESNVCLPTMMTLQFDVVHGDETVSPVIALQSIMSFCKGKEYSPM